eukprot:5600541-Pleurochrysis_carterae.AAC.2
MAVAVTVLMAAMLVVTAVAAVDEVMARAASAVMGGGGGGGGGGDDSGVGVGGGVGEKGLAAVDGISWRLGADRRYKFLSTDVKCTTVTDAKCSHGYRFEMHTWCWLMRHISDSIRSSNDTSTKLHNAGACGGRLYRRTLAQSGLCHAACRPHAPEGPKEEALALVRDCTETTQRQS